MKSKNEYRKFAKFLRETLNINEISKNIHKNLKEISEYKNAKNIFIYNSCKNEICTQSYFSDVSKKWFLPRVEGDYMAVCPYDPNNLKESKFGIMEPATKKISDLCDIDLVILPALCIDKQGNRIGYGKGYYDKFLDPLTSCPVKIALIPEELLFERVPSDYFDVKCDIIVTQNNVYYV